MPSCFVICPIGQEDTEERERADALVEEIRVALQPFGFREEDVRRGDHNIESKEIASDVVRCVQDFDLCIAEISEENPNVYYEVGRREETGKPIIYLRHRDSLSQKLPADITSFRYLEYELDTRKGARDFRTALASMITPYAKAGFDSSGKGATLGEVAAILERVERKLDRMARGKRQSDWDKEGVDDDYNGLSPSEAFNLALLMRNVRMAENAMLKLEGTMEFTHFFDLIVEQAATMGSTLAGEMLLDRFGEFLDSDVSIRKKIEYIGSIVGYANRNDKEEEVRNKVEEGAKALIEAISVLPASGESANDIADIYNQLNRLYYGIYSNTDDESYAIKALNMLDLALENAELKHLLYNRALVRYRAMHDTDGAKSDMDRCLELDDEPDADHLELAYQIYRELEDPRSDDLLEQLREINPGKAKLLTARCLK